jgi:radical SAM protein with 4Fe4S-binding SPASM domain
MINFKLYKRLISCVMANPAYFYYVIFRKDHERLTNQLKSGQMPQKESFFPSKLDLRVTYRCNLSCKMCGQWGETGTYKDYSREKTNKGLKFETLKNIINELTPKGLRFIDIEGGETFLYSDIIDLLALCKEKRLFVKPVTNGSLLTRYAKDIVSLGVDVVVVSIDGPRETHNLIRGASWSYDQALEGIRALREEQKRQNKHMPFVIVSYTMTRYNGADSLIQLVDDLSKESLGDLLSVKVSPIFIPDAAGESYVNLVDKYFGVKEGITSWKGFQEDYSNFEPETKKIVQTLADLKKRNLPFYIETFPRINHDLIPRLYLDYDWTLGRTHCSIPYVEPTIDADGNVYSCNLFTDESLSMGNIYEQPFLDIWHGKMFDQFRQMINDQKNGLLPICNRCCQFVEH